MIGVTFDGIKEFEAAFSRLSDVDRMKFFSEEFAPIGNKIVAEMQAQTPVSKAGVLSKMYASRTHAPGNLRKSIGKKLGGEQIPTMWISLNRKKAYDAWYQHIVVGGHEYGGTTIPPNPIVRRTWDKMMPWVESQLKARISNKLKFLMQ